jgi:Methyltransferase domain
MCRLSGDALGPGDGIEPVLPSDAFRRLDETPDADFYRQARFVTHIDEGAIAAVTQLYRERFPPGGAVLDVMSSWVSHLPPEVAYRHVAGLGMNRDELAANPRLDSWVVHDLNTDPCLPFADGAFDAAGCCVSIDYLVHPVKVLRDLGRVLRPGGPLVVTFSNRRFPTKVVALWEALDDAGHGELVAHYLRAAGGWRDIARLDRSPAAGDPLLAVVATRASSPGERRGDGSS